jgi:hypothetical protein
LLTVSNEHFHAFNAPRWLAGLMVYEPVNESPPEPPYIRPSYKWRLLEQKFVLFFYPSHQRILHCQRYQSYEQHGRADNISQSSQYELECQLGVFGSNWFGIVRQGGRNVSLSSGSY